MMGWWGDGVMGRWGDAVMGRWGDGWWGDGEMGRWGDGEGGSLQARRGPRFPMKDASQSGAWAGGLTAGATPGRTVI